MKTDTIQVNHCVTCPYFKLARLTLPDVVNPALVTYCGKRAGVMPNNSGSQMLYQISQAMFFDLEGIPDWCPLPDKNV